MDSSDFSILIGRLEREAEERPRLYAAKVAGVAALGYLCLSLVAIGVLAACSFILQSVVSGGRPSGWMVLGLAAGICTLFAMVRALWVRLDEPADLQITREASPELFALIDDVSTRMSGVPLAGVTINSEFNASIRQIPRWGVFGNYRNHLQLGLPLLTALSVEEFAAVLAHEMGHLSGQHGQFSAWIYRQRMTWHALRRKFEEPANVFDQVLAWFYGWYAPYFHAYSFVLARNHEYAADRAAAHFTDAQSLGRALTKLELMGRFLSEIFWERLFAQVEKAPEPPYRPYSLMQRAFKVAEKDWSRQEWLRESLSRYAAEDDTHPSLAERLAALDITPALPGYDADASALSLLGPMAPDLINYCDEAWRADNVANWRKRHDELKEARWKIAEYEAYETSALGPEDLWAKANLLLNVNRDADGIEALQLLIAREGAWPKAHLLLGHLLLGRGDEHGLQHLLQAAEQDVELISTAGTMGYGYLVNRGRKGEAMRFWERISAAAAA
ncbi:MAG: M48 family metallopeptidase [Steroidobacter sp.]